jgi:3-phosphoglycerate kinase
VHASSPHAAKSFTERLAAVVADLHRRGSARPRTVKTLTSTIGALFQKQLSEHEVASLIEGLKAQGIVTVGGTKVSYELPHRVA